MDGNLASSLAVVRSLAARGLEVHAADHMRGFLASYSRRCSASFAYPDPMVEPEAFTRWVIDRAERGGYDLVIPVTDKTLLPLAAARNSFTEVTRLAAAPDESLAVTTSKLRTLRLAERLGVPTPASRFIAGEDELIEAAHDHPLPAVLKPDRSVARIDDDVRAHLAVRYAYTPEEIVDKGRPLLRYGPLVLQEYVRGEGVGVEVLADRGEVVFAFQHRRLHELPLTGGGSALRESVAVSPELLNDAEKLVRATGYHGVAMVEFKHDLVAGTYCLMEINGRFWGSLPLGVVAGADFPAFLYDLEVHGRRPDARPARIGICCRNVSRDLDWLVAVLRRSPPDPLIEWPSRVAALFGFLKVFMPGHYLDVERLGDPLPGAVGLCRTLRDLARGFVRSRRRRTALGLTRRLRSRPEALIPRLRSAKEVLFICAGNINRSLLAEYCLHDSGNGRRFVSAGFHPRDDRAPDPMMKEVAARHGLVIKGARSRRVDELMVDSADVVFVMEADHFLRLREEFPCAASKTWLLGCLGSGDQPLEVADPHGGDRAAYERCFGEIRALTTALAARLESE